MLRKLFIRTEKTIRNPLSFSCDFTTPIIGTYMTGVIILHFAKSNEIAIFKKKRKHVEKQIRKSVYFYYSKVYLTK